MEDTDYPHDEEIFTASLAEPAAKVRSSRTGPRWTTPLITLSIAALVLGPVLWKWVPREIARWHVAVAMEKHSAGDAEQAIARLDKALEWDAESDWIYRQRGDWHVEAGRYEAAIEDYSRAVGLAPEDPRNYMQRSVARQHLGQHDRSIEDWQQIEKLLEAGTAQHRAIAWNGLAYARALGNTDLDQALEDVNRALDIFGPDPAMLDTRGFIQFLRGELDAARQDLEQAVEAIELQHAALTRQRSYSDYQEHQQRLKQHAHSVAVLRYHRALVYEKLGKRELAEQDLRRVRQLGHEPDGKQLF
jgi:tetratricopeptide (TPR) repeat protein